MNDIAYLDDTVALAPSLDLSKLHLLDRTPLMIGCHSHPSNGACALELISMMMDEPFSDRPRCVCEVIANFVRRWNDRIFDTQERNRLLKPLLIQIIDSNQGIAVAVRRKMMIRTWLAYEVALIWQKFAVDAGIVVQPLSAAEKHGIMTNFARSVFRHDMATIHAVRNALYISQLAHERMQNLRSKTMMTRRGPRVSTINDILVDDILINTTLSLFDDAAYTNQQSRDCTRAVRNELKASATGLVERMVALR